MRWDKTFLIICFSFFLSACGHHSWNNPYPSDEETANVYYASYAEQPKTLDPARAYSSDEMLFIGQIYEPPLQYHYLKRPYTLVPLIATEVPQPVLLDKNKKVLPPNANPKNIAFSVYKIHIKPNVYYQPHPAFARDAKGKYLYHQLNEQEINNTNQLKDFSKTGTRELIAADYVYQINRLLNPRVQSPVYSVLRGYISDAAVVDKYTYVINVKGYYPQFIYWLAMPFFSPMPWEADKFYSQPGMKDNNVTLDWYPIGTGAYMLTENNPNRQMVLVRNPNFHDEKYPLTDLKLPFIDKFIFTLEKESIPRWNKFLQGYYDQSAISSDSFDQAVSVDEQGQPEVTPLLKEKNIHLQTSVAPSLFYFGFNMLDPIVGGESDRARKLRQAIAIGLDYEEFIAIFLNGRGIPAQGPIPPGIFGYQDGRSGMNPTIYNWINNQAQRKSLNEARELMKEAGYENGLDPKTHKQLLLNFDVASGGSADDRALFAWLRKQFAKLGIELQIRDTQYNRFQEKIRAGQTQLFSWGWNADYPDPENFLFLLYGENGKVKHGGENAANYKNQKFDELFIKMRNMPNSAERQIVIDQMLNIVWRDTPWVWGFYPQSFTLAHEWVGFTKPNAMANNTLKYMSIDPALRAQSRLLWNTPIVWPIFIGLLVVVIVIVPVFILYWRRQHYPLSDRKK